ncbi:FecR family protein [Sunxiuqinia sp. A32]|uniref:FecR family protein n=1 Tax=Sunxiuqinia sp. A32 TaxID=3461496 RepID=UPI00404653B8
MKNKNHIPDNESTEQVELMEKLFEDNKPIIEKVASVDVEKAWQKTLSTKRRNTFRIYLQKALPYAAAIVLVLLTGYYIGTQSNQAKQSEAYTVFNIPNSEMGNLTLPDGTKIAINSASELKYSADFLRSRHLYLKGEAFFEVTSNPKNPFFVHIDDFTVKVTGTKFNVKSYAGSNPETTLEEGKISVLNPDGKSIAELKPSENLIFDKNEKQFLISTINTHQKTGWREGKIFFKNQTIEEMAEVLERWYNVQVLFENESIKDVKLTGTILKDKPIEQLLTVLVRSEPIEFEVSEESALQKTITLRNK